MYVYCGVRLDERNVRWVYDYNGNMCDLSRWKFLCWGRGPTRRVHLHCGLLFGLWYRHGVRWHDRIVRDVYRWEIVRWCRGSTRFVHLHCGLLFGRRCRHGVRWHDRIVRSLYSWKRVCRCCDPTRSVHLFDWLLFTCWCGHDMRRHVSVVHVLHSWQFVCRQYRPASLLHVQCGVRFHGRDIRWVHNDNGNLRGMSSGELVRWWRGPARCMHLHGRLLLRCWCCDDV